MSTVRQRHAMVVIVLLFVVCAGWVHFAMQRSIAPQPASQSVVGHTFLGANASPICSVDSLVARLLRNGSPESPRGPARPLTVACLGDSITYGNGAHTGTMNPLLSREGNYPMELGKLLSREMGRSVNVQNFGKRGATALDTQESISKKESYRRVEQFLQYMVKRVEMAPELILFMLGTNDSKPRQWVSRPAFEQALEELCLTALNGTSAQLVLMVAPPSLPDVGANSRHSREGCCKILWDVNSTRAESDIRDGIYSVAKKLNVPVIDFYLLWKRLYPEFAADRKLLLTFRNDKRVLVEEGSAAFDAAVRTRKLLTDGIHPTVDGHATMAEHIVDSICRNAVDE